MSRLTRTLLLLLLAALAAPASMAAEQAQEVTQLEADLTLDCLSGDDNACKKLKELQAGKQAPAAASSDSHVILFDTYKMSSVRPRELDAFVVANRSLYDDRFFGCLSSIKTKAPILAQVSDQQCMMHIDSLARSNCMQQNPWRGMGPYLNDLEQSIASNGEVGWLQTASGRQQANIVQIFDNLLQEFRQETYAQLVFTLGQQIADQRLEMYAAQLYGGLDKSAEALRDALYCP